MAQQGGDRAGAAEMYSAEVEVNSQAEGERERGFGQALAQVLGKLSGDRSTASAPGVRSELRQAGQYVKGYDYRQDEGRSASGAPTFKTTLVVQFDPDRVEALAAALGLPVWPTPRPRPVLWLAIDDGSGPRLVGVPQAEAARPTLDRARTRGYQLGLPGGNAAERALVAAIWRGDAGAIRSASSRYRSPMQLVGKMYRQDGGWRADWTFIDDGEVLSQWSEDGGSPRQVLSSGADGAADALVARYAKRIEAGEAGEYHVAFTGIDSAEDYLRLSGYLQGLAVVRAIRPLQADPGRMEYRLQLASGLPGFNLMVEGDDVLVAEHPAGTLDDSGFGSVPSAPAPASGVATYRLR
ncbi:DUF2066 domain-containing protein [Lysobacter sp. GX 14042]|uniref:DUF2066 domain-containing protein n=1 Tax=Lysobacter sp. GX 14042 TaxID=2907155 RepID=UPI0031BAEC1A